MKKQTNKKRSVKQTAGPTNQSEGGAGAKTAPNSVKKSGGKKKTSGSKRTPDKKQAVDSGVKSWVRKGMQFLREAKTELKKVKWPTRKELLASTAVVIVLTLAIAFFLGLVDFGLIKLIKTIVG
jgi:preprotein translocase subunit SecE